MKANRLLVVFLALFLSWSFRPVPVSAQLGSPAARPPQAADQAAQASGPSAGSPLADEQQSVAERYRRLEELLLRLADMEADENAERAALLRRAAKQSRDMFVLDKLSTASQSIRNAQFKNAIDSQGAAKDGLDRLLTLLLSEDRPQRLRDEKERVGKMIKELKLVERLQRTTRARTENGADLEAISDEQKQVAERAGKVSEAMKDEDAPAEGESSEPQPSEDGADEKNDDSKPSESKPSDSKASDGKESKPKDGDSKEADSKPAESGKPKNSEMKPGEPKDGEPKDGEPKDGESKPDSGEKPPMPSESEPSAPSGDSKPQDSKPQPSQPGQPPQPGQPAEDSPQQQKPQSPEQEAQQQLQQAIEKMKQAEKELDEAKRDKAIDQQQKAEENLRAAIDRLEKILRQLREEEMQRELARLESRLRKMAQMQGKVLDDTKQLDAIPVSQRDRQVDVRAGNLAFEEKKIVMEADRAMLLLQEEGSSVAFPEVVSQIRGDMETVAQRLATSKIDAVTIGIQEDILAALEEMIAALQKAQRDLEKQKQEQQQQQQQQQQQSGEQPLVEQLAELRLIRTMETRIMSTTERYAKILSEAGDTSDVLPLVKDLAERQTNLYRITRDIVQKRNQ